MTGRDCIAVIAAGGSVLIGIPTHAHLEHIVGPLIEGLRELGVNPIVDRSRGTIFTDTGGSARVLSDVIFQLRPASCRGFSVDGVFLEPRQPFTREFVTALHACVRPAQINPHEGIPSAGASTQGSRVPPAGSV